MTEPRSSPSNPDPVELERRKQANDVATPEAVSTLAGGNGTFTDKGADTPAAPYAERTHPDPVRDEGIVEPAPIQPGGISLATIVTIGIVVVLALILLFWLL